MHPKSPKSLESIQVAIAQILDATKSRSLDDYLNDHWFRSGVERKLQIIGEALLRLERDDPATCGRFADYRRMIGLRNRLVHGYDTEVDHSLVWQLVVDHGPSLLETSSELLDEAERKFFP